MPKNSWYTKTVSELLTLACVLGDNNANWVEQALVWAQRISNGESWEAVCNHPDTASCKHIVIWKGGELRIVGGPKDYFDYKEVIPASNVGAMPIYPYYTVRAIVPLVVSYEK